MDGKVALVTGGSRGIGEATATALCREGARVAIASRKRDGLEAAADRIRAEVPGATVGVFPCHMGEPDQVAALVDAVWAELGPIDGLVNNAAANPYFGPMMGADWGAWDKTFEVNLKGPFELSRLVAKRLSAAKRPGSIVFVSSVFGMGGAPLQGIYGMTKAALLSLTKTLAVEWGPAGIRVNAVAPGLVETRFASALTGNPAFARQFTDRAALGRFAQPEEIAGAVVYLLADESGFVTGSTLVVDGGYAIR